MTYTAPSPTQSNNIYVFHKWDEPAQVFFLFCLPSYLMELLWISTQQGQKRSFPKPSKSSARILNCQTKVHFPLEQNEISSVEKCIHQARYNKTKQKTAKGALIIAHFQEDQTKYQPSQTHSHICKDPYPKSQAAGWNIRNISCLRCGMPNSGKVLLEKAGRIYMLEKIVSSA